MQNCSLSAASTSGSSSDQCGVLSSTCTCVSVDPVLQKTSYLLQNGSKYIGFGFFVHLLQHSYFSSKLDIITEQGPELVSHCAVIGALHLLQNVTGIHQLFLDLDFTFPCKRQYSLKIILKFAKNLDTFHILTNSYLTAKSIGKNNVRA